jgi:hypothetical protein
MDARRRVDLAALHALSIDAVPGLPGDGTVIVHGDFGPQNLLFDFGNEPSMSSWTTSIRRDAHPACGDGRGPGDEHGCGRLVG